jgi:hypothetical protein
MAASSATISVIGLFCCTSSASASSVVFLLRRRYDRLLRGYFCCCVVDDGYRLPSAWLACLFPRRQQCLAALRVSYYLAMAKSSASGFNVFFYAHPASTSRLPSASASTSFTNTTACRQQLASSSVHISLSLASSSGTLSASASSKVFTLTG